jgi:ABC-type glycerol-3-phosphate transport system substrate-binding protein
VRLLYWNKDAFQEAGLAPETPPGTWEELRRAALRLTRRDGAERSDGLTRLGFHTQEDESHYLLFAWQAGGGFLTSDGRKATFSTVPNQQALQWMVDLMRDQGGVPAANTFRDGWGRNEQHAFLTGQLGMRYSTNGRAGSTIARYRPDLRFGVAPPPVRRTGDRPLTWSGGFAYTMCAGAPEADASWALTTWLISEEGLRAGYDGDAARARAAGGAYAPGLSGQPALDRRLSAHYRTGLPLVDAVPDLAIRSLSYTRFREHSLAATALWDAASVCQAQAISQEKSVQQALADANTRAQQALDEAWAGVRA